MQNVYATCVSLNQKGVLILGKSGAGKSDLAFRLIEQCGAVLVADDRTNVSAKENDLYAACPENIKGLMELRGIGIIKKNFEPETIVKLAVELVDDYKQIERLPEKEYMLFEGIKIRKIKIYPFEASAVYKIRLVCDEIE